MNESILQALMRLFALVAYVNEKGQAGIERDVVYEYLQRQFSSELVEKYLQIFDQYLAETQPDLTSFSQSERVEFDAVNSRAIVDLCNKLNLELQQEQKIYIMVFLLDFISSGEQLSTYQFRIIDEITQRLNIPPADYHAAKHFTFGEFDKLDTRENLLFIDSSLKVPDKQIKHLFIDKLEGRITVLLIPGTNTYVLRYYGSQVLLLNGHDIKTNRSYIWAPGAVVKNPKFGSVYYTWVAGQFIKASSQTQFVFKANEIEFSYGNSPNGIKRFNLNEESGRLIGIIGGSGSGKSTLLKVMAGIIKPHHGTIEINGKDIHRNSEDFEGLIGYVPQDEFLIKELTVFENLYYNAKFSFNTFSEAEIKKLVDKALLDFDLVEARNLRVGDAFNTYLSGGQRKRLNIALELLREPAVLFVDEPTSGLSSSDSEKVMNLLKRQTFKGKLVFANIHQPSSEIFKLFDKLLVVDQGGRVVYYGNPVDAIGYFKHINHFVDADASECLSCGNINPDQILRNIEARVVDVNGRLTRKRKTSPQEWYKLYMDRIDPIIRNIKRPHSDQLPKSNFAVPKRWEQLKLYFKRDLLAKLKNSQYLFVTTLEAPVLAMLLAFYTRSSRDLGGNITSYFFGLNHNIPAYLFMAVIVAIFLGLVISAEEIYRDRKLLERERFLNLSRSSYLFSKAGITFMISAFQMLLFVLIGNYILEIRGMTWRYFLILFTAAAWANLVGLNISSGFKSVVTIYILVPLILVPQLLFSGVVVDFYNLNKNIQSFKYVPAVGDAMTSRWAYEAIVVTQFRDNPFEKNFFDAEQQMSDAHFIKAYLVPELLDRLDYIKNNIDDRKNYNQVVANLELLSNEIKKLNLRFSEKQPGLMRQLNIQDFNEETYNKARNFLIKVNNHFHNKYIEALLLHDENYKLLVEKLGGKEAFMALKNKYYNTQLASIVQNEKEMIQFFVHQNNIIKLKDPIFTLPASLNGRAHYYAPVKRVGGYYFDTFWYNLIVIWLNTVLLFGVLYFDILLKLIRYFENIRLRRFNRRIMNILSKQYDNR
ncbi:MAG: ATP-binding cassette domain-containing protein [Bacteroidales bacterium]|nr:ATP-binding cassette domain-containing protein [Bacteroidales bacterium]